VRSTLRAVAVIGLTASLLLAACGDDAEEVNAADGGGDAAALEGTQWVLDLDTLDVGSTGGAMATLLLQDGQAAGTDGCNQFNGTYELDGSDLTFGALATTQMACTAELTSAGTKVTEGLEATESFSISGSTLTLEGADGPVLTYEAASATALVGDWQIIAYLDEANEAFTSTTAGDQPASITFADDGTVSGFAGCNTFSGGYTADASTITFEPLATTRMACEPAELMTEEATLLAALQSATTWQATAMGVDLFRADGIRVISLAPPA
jgi:heat shock protein HslJ